ncbi:hypothetical protein EAH87_07700 [Sphingomonas koreensis]|nr:hypothetical protein EAH87_07700 [Sphingomonas koreensis]
MNDRSHWWQTRWFVAAIAFASIVPLIWPTIPPMVDLPGHMGRYRVQLDLARDPWFSQWYHFQWRLIGNLGIDLLVIPLSKLFGLELAVKLIVMAIPLLTVSGLLWIAREVHGRIPATALFALPLAYSYPFHFGFVNFALAMALALNAFALWLRLARLDRMRLRAAIFVPLSCLLWVCHTYGWGVLGVLAFSAELVRQRDRGHNWAKAWVLAIPHCLALCLPLVMMVIWRGGQHVSGQTADYFNWTLKWRWVKDILRDRWKTFDLASLAVIGLLLVKSLRDRTITYSRNLTLSALFLIAVYLVLPRIVFGSAYADMRLAPFMLAVLVIGLRERPGRHMRDASMVAALGLAFTLVRLTATTVSFAMYAQSYKTELAALDHVPMGARVLGMVGGHCQDVWAMSRLEHLPAMTMVRRRGFSNDQWEMPGAQLMSVTYRAAMPFAHDPSEIVTERRCPRQLWKTVDQSLAEFPRGAFDYVWLINPPRYDPALVSDLQPVWRAGASVLFKVPEQQAPLAEREAKALRLS